MYILYVWKYELFELRNIKFKDLKDKWKANENVMFTVASQKTHSLLCIALHVLIRSVGWEYWALGAIVAMDLNFHFTNESFSVVTEIISQTDHAQGWNKFGNSASLNWELGFHSAIFVSVYFGLV